MSGGSYDYAYSRVEEMAHGIERRDSSPRRRAFSRHLMLVAKAMHDVEWVDSCDYGEDGDEDSIRAVMAPGSELEAAIAMAKETLEMLTGAIEAAKTPGEDTPLTAEVPVL